MIYHLFYAHVYHHVPNIIEGILKNAKQTNIRGIQEHFFLLRVTNSASINLESNSYSLNTYNELFIKYGIVNYCFLYYDYRLIHKILNLCSDDQLILHDNHSLFGRPTLFWVFIYLLRHKLMKRISLVLWSVPETKRLPKNTIHSYLLSITTKSLRSLKNIILLTTDDENKVKEWHRLTNTKVTTYIWAITKVNSNINHEYKKRKSPIKIMVSHSAQPHNQQIEVLKMLEKYKNEDIRIICPLSYGLPSYRKEIIRTGKKIFGNKFEYILEFLPEDEYDKLLESIDIYISNSIIQTGLYVVYFCIGSGEKMYLKGNNLNWVNYLGAHAFNVKDIKQQDYQEFIKPLADDQRQHNIQLSIQRLKLLSTKLIKDWKQIYK